MNLIISLIKRDFRFTFKNILLRNIFFSVIFFIFSFLTVMKSTRIGVDNINLFYIQLKGIKNVGELPFIWLIINFFIIFNLGDNFYNDLRKNGKYVLVRCRNLKYFYIVKVFLLICNTIIYYILLFGIMFLLSKIFLNPAEVALIEGININNKELIRTLILLYTTTSISLVLIQNMLSLVIKPKYSSLIIVVILLLSVIINSSILPGQHCLILRHVPFDNITNLTLIKSVLYNLILSAITVMVGYGIFFKKDIY